MSDKTTLERILDGDTSIDYTKLKNVSGMTLKALADLARKRIYEQVPDMEKLLNEYERLKSEYQLINMRYESAESIIRVLNTTVDTQAGFINSLKDQVKQQSTFLQHSTPRSNSLTSDSSQNHDDDENNNNRQSSSNHHDENNNNRQSPPTESSTMRLSQLHSTGTSTSSQLKYNDAELRLLRLSISDINNRSIKTTRDNLTFRAKLHHDCSPERVEIAISTISQIEAVHSRLSFKSVEELRDITDTWEHFLNWLESALHVRSTMLGNLKGVVTNYVLDKNLSNYSRFMELVTEYHKTGVADDTLIVAFAKALNRYAPYLERNFASLAHLGDAAIHTFNNTGKKITRRHLETWDLYLKDLSVSSRVLSNDDTETQRIRMGRSSFTKRRNHRMTRKSRATLQKKLPTSQPTTPKTKDQEAVTTKVLEVVTTTKRKPTSQIQINGLVWHSSGYYIKVVIGDQTFDAMVDLGSQASLIDPDLLPTLGLESSPCNEYLKPVAQVKGFYAKALVDTKVTIPGSIDDKDYNISVRSKLFVVKNQHKLIIGNNLFGLISPIAHLFADTPHLIIPVKLGKQIVSAKVLVTSLNKRAPKSMMLTNLNKLDLTKVSRTAVKAVASVPLPNNSSDATATTSVPTTPDVKDSLPSEPVATVATEEPPITEQQSECATSDAVDNIDGVDLPVQEIDDDTDDDDEEEEDEDEPVLSSSDAALDAMAATILSAYKRIIVDALPENHSPDRGKFNMNILLKGDASAFNIKHGRRSIELESKISAEVAKLLEIGVIEEAPPNTEFCSPAFFVNKGTSKERMVVDFKHLNSMTVDDVFPMERLDEIIESIGGAKIFSVIDAKSGFYQMLLNPGSRRFTTFAANKRLYMFTRPCFGLKNSPAYFNRWLQHVLDPLVKKGFVRVYVDDILIFSKSVAEHEQHLKQVFELLDKNDVYVAKSKCHLFKYSVSYAGHMLSDKGIKPLYNKVNAILNRSVPTTVKEMRSFIGAINHYRRYLNHMGPQLARLTSTISTKYRKINLTDQEIADFNDIKTELCSSRCLMSPRYDRTFHVYTDASDVGSGLMIAQYDDNNNLRPVLFDARKFDSAQRNYSARDRELLAFIHAVTRYGYLLSRPFVFHTDHKNLIYNSQNDMDNPRLVRWSEILSRFSFQTSYIPGKENCMADYLSRAPDFYTPWDNDLLNDILASYSSELPKATRDWFNSFKRRQDITVINDLYYWIDGDNMRLVVLDPASITSIINEAHSSPYSGHVAYGRMLTKLNKSYVWPNMCDTISKFVKKCVQCQRSSIKKIKEGFLASLPLPDRPWCDISMDLLALPAADTGEGNLFVVVDRFTKMTRLFPCHKDVTAIQLGNWFAREIIAVFGAPSSIVSDRDPKFTSELWTSSMKAIGTELKMTQPGRAQADGQTERTNRSILSHIRKWTDKKHSWATDIRFIEACINNNISYTTQFTPNQLLYGYEPKLPWNANYFGIREYKDCQNQYRLEAKNNALDAQLQQAKQHDKVISNFNTYNINDLVLVRRSRLNTHKSSSSDDRKLTQSWGGPFIIVKQVSDINYRIRLQNKRATERTIHVDDIKPFIGDPTGTDLLDINAIIDKRQSKRGTGTAIEYLVKFDTDSDDHNKWINENTLIQYIPTMIESFNKQQKK
ncbi:hypothetical protein PPL_01285 [Heterostelium album PN500]|uniref:RNA-directed DNA polymerase n=1 Tax=Heterostelium pallidum (strain ATCC 26659 / Pp 5 / PN500) TaxID=670386 RepID=D3AYM3_HETP5|nr:hypothetical protein PPL_01285 [Heterostelium album PN500]EFA86050.1 hypothetical protein PPL_01285 [Heterostelium album PN500]|eukprot:XP_020438156.1 hypothetical protein PPL_01285 [Heterostelium album PN500]